MLTLEERFWQAANDPAFYDQHFAADGLMVLPYGVGVLDKQSTIYAVSGAAPWSSFRIELPRLVQQGDHCVALIYRATARRAGDTSDYSALISSVYVQQGGDWKLAVHQQTPS